MRHSPNDKRTRVSNMCLCSMVGRQEYYQAARAWRLLEILWGWVVLESHDKGCTERFFGPTSPEPSSSCRLATMGETAAPQSSASGVCI